MVWVSRNRDGSLKGEKGKERGVRFIERLTRKGEGGIREGQTAFKCLVW